MPAKHKDRARGPQTELQSNSVNQQVFSLSLKVKSPCQKISKKADTA